MNLGTTATRTLAAAAVLSLAGCGRFANEDQKQDHKQRIVCISKQYSEIIYALSAERDLVAVDISSTYPTEIKRLPTIGYHRALSAEAILAMRPTLILEDNNIGPEHVVRQLRDLNIPMKDFGTHGDDLAGTESLIREMGSYFHQEQNAEALCAKLDDSMKLALGCRERYKDTPKVLVIHFGQASNRYLAMTKRSTAGKIIGWAGGTMALDDGKGMKALSPETVAASDPDVILMTDFGYERLGGALDKIQDLPGVAATRAFRNRRIHRVEEHDLVYLGPRTGENVMALQKLIHRDEQTE